MLGRHVSRLLIEPVEMRGTLWPRNPAPSFSVASLHGHVDAHAATRNIFAGREALCHAYLSDIGGRSSTGSAFLPSVGGASLAVSVGGASLAVSAGGDPVLGGAWSRNGPRPLRLMLHPPLCNCMW